MNSLNILRQSKIKNTAARRIILEMLLNDDNCLSAEDLYKECIRLDKNINLSTVYRTLELFEDKALIDKINIGNGKYSYAFKNNAHKHILECSLCHKEIEVDCPMKQIEELIKNKTGFTMMEHQLYIKGVCDTCKD